MSVPAASVGGRRCGSLIVPVLIACVALAVLLLLPRLGQSEAPAASTVRSSAATGTTRSVPQFPNRAPASVWGSAIDAKVRFQQAIDRMPEGGPYVFRVTELEMEPGTRIMDHRQLSAGAHVVVRGDITIDDLDHGTSATYGAGQAYFEGLDWLHRAVNAGSGANRVLMFDLLPASRGFDGTQQFTDRGRHNEGELRSGPYVQVPLDELPAGPLMLRVTDLNFGPKAKSVEHVHVGPTLFFVQEGTATVRKNWNNSSTTFGTNGYFFESGREPYILENKPASPAHFISVEIVPASIGNGPTTIPTED
jgi:quercetin dioxygenase-like cupin family protein